MAQVPVRERVVEVTARLGDGTWQYGSGMLIGGRTLLTAAHVVDGAVAVQAKRPDKQPLTVAWPDERALVGHVDQFDVALLDVEGIDPLEPVQIARIDRDVPSGEVVVERCWAVGYPVFQEIVDRDRPPVRETAHVRGVVSPLAGLAEGRVLSFRVTATPKELPPADQRLEQSPWEGMSGAVVCAGDRVLGVVTEHAPRRGASDISFTPLDRLLSPAGAPDDARTWQQRLGMLDPDRLRLLPRPDRGADVRIGPGQSLVVGDYATVFQTFVNSPSTMATFLRVPQFRSLVDRHTRYFVGRGFVFERIDEILHGTDLDSGYILIRGEPGIGKSAIAATLVARHGYLHHFNIVGDNIRTARQFLENTCAQLVLRFGLDYATLPHQAGEDSGFLMQLLSEAAAIAPRPLVVVVDALDEVDDTGLPAAANRLFLPATLPSGVFFIVTSREEHDYRLHVDELEEIWIREDDPEHRGDVMTYVETFIGSNDEVMTARIEDWGLTADEFVEEVTSLSEGNFMYLFHVLRDIARGRLTRQSIDSIDQLPRGLKSYYLRHWRTMKDEDPERFTMHQRPVLCFLAAGEEPVSLDQLCDWTGLGPAEVKGVLRQWREFLNEVDGRWRLYHRSFADFLDEHESLPYYHDQISQTALDKVPGF